MNRRNQTKAVMNPYPPAFDPYNDDDLPLEDRYQRPQRPHYSQFRRTLAAIMARMLILIGIAAVIAGIRSDLNSDQIVYPLFIARSYIFFPSYVSVGIVAEVSLTWRLLVALWILGLIAFVWFSHEKLFAVLAYVGLPVQIVVGSFQLTGTGSLYWHSGSLLIDGQRYHQVAVHTDGQEGLTDLWFQCNATGFLCFRVDNPNTRPPAQ